jgi:hypothetical protein
MRCSGSLWSNVLCRCLRATRAGIVHLVNAIPASERSRARRPDRVHAHRNTSSVEPPRRNASSIPSRKDHHWGRRKLPGIDDHATASERIHPSPPHFEQLHHCPHGLSPKTRCTTLVPTPSVLPILRMPSPLGSQLQYARFDRRFDAAPA